MNATQIKVLSTGLLFVLIFVSGFWLSHLEKPYKLIPFTIHKLIGLAAVIFLFSLIKQIHQSTPLTGIEIFAIVVTTLLFVGTVVAGGLASIDKPMLAVFARLHRLLPYLTVVSTSGTLYLMVS